MTNDQLVIEISGDGGSIRGNGKLFLLSGVELGREVKPVAGRDWSLADLVQAIIGFQESDFALFDERVQLETGRWLYKQTLGQLPEREQRTLLDDNGLDVRILTGDEWIARLPWPLLAHEGIFRAAAGWAVSVCRKQAMTECELPPSPRLLIVAPQPRDVAGTGAMDHLEELEEMLSSHDPRLSSKNHLQTATTWEAFVRLTEEFQPELVYYYGHGTGDGDRTRLLFATGENFQKIEKPLSDFALCLRKLKKPPLLAYMNCCLGDAGGFLGAGMQLGDFIPAVITNRTVAYIDVARAQALRVWRDILQRAQPPHRAVAGLFAGMDLQRMSTADFRWITPVCHAHYSHWRATQPVPPDRLTQDPHWHLKIDRVSQYNSVMAQTRLMLREQKPKSLVFTWYGEEGQGIEIFHKRLLVELREDLSNSFVWQVRPAWPMHFDNYHASFSDMLCQVFEVNSLEDIPARIRSESRGASGKQTLVYVRHEPVRSAAMFDPADLKEYVSWQDNEVAPLLEKNQFVLLSASFLVNNPPAFAEYVEEEGIEELDTKKTVFWLLNEMENVAKRDLLLFLRTHSIDLPGERRDKVLQKILAKTKGRYEQTIEELKKLRQEAWRVEDEKANAGKRKKKFEY